jgi:hypothetical protein
MQKYGGKPSVWSSTGAPGYIQIPTFTIEGFLSYCTEVLIINNPFNATSRNGKAPIVLSARYLNISIVQVNSEAHISILPTDLWTSFDGPHGPVLRIGNGTYISPNVSARASLLFTPKSTKH